MKIFLLKRRTLAAVLALVCVLAGCYAILHPGTLDVDSNTADRLLPIYCVDRGDTKVCSLTFDAAWDDADTDILIETLGKYNVRATFFMVGSWVEKYPESVKKFAQAGHEIANHSNSHPHINQLSDAKIREEITLCDEKIEQVTGVRPTLFRGPYGEYNNAVVAASEELGHKVIQWDVDSLDWKDLAVDDIVARVTKRVKPGSIMLFHNGAKNTPAALPKILEKLTADGYQFVPVSEMIYPDNYTIDNAGCQKPNQ